MLALKAGNEDVLVKSSNIEFLLTRLKCLIRMRDTRLELNLREDTDRARGFEKATLASQVKRKAVLMASETNLRQVLIAESVSVNGFDVNAFSEEALFANKASLRHLSCFILCQSDLSPHNATNLLLYLGSSSDVSHTAILIATTEEDLSNAVHALEMGANEIFFEHYDRSEII